MEPANDRLLAQLLANIIVLVTNTEEGVVVSRSDGDLITVHADSRREGEM